MVKIMSGENQIRNWKFHIYVKQWNTDVDRSWCGGAWLPGRTGNLIFIDGILDKYKYLNILKNKESARKLRLLEDFHFQQDTDPKHTARIVKEWIVYNTPHMLITPPQSDINLIENLWDEIGKRWNKFHIISKEVLKDKIIEIWNSVECSFTKSLLYSMERRLRYTIAAKNGPTKY